MANLDWIIDNQQALKAGSAVLLGASAVCVLFPALTSKALSLMFCGTFLSVGFWGGKKLTNYLDTLVIMNNKDMLANIMEELK